MSDFSLTRRNMPVCLIFRGYGRNENYSKMMKTYKKTKNNDKHVMVFKVLYTEIQKL